MERFRGRVALVTGASAGIGVAVARQLSVDHGMKVVGCARRIDRLKDLEVTVSDLAKASGSGGKFFGVECDLDKDEDIRKMFDWIRNHPELGQVDVCVANAGLHLKCPCLESQEINALFLMPPSTSISPQLKEERVRTYHLKY